MNNDEIDNLLKVLDYSSMFNGDLAYQAATAIRELRNPWLSVKNHLPDKGVPVLLGWADDDSYEIDTLVDDDDFSEWAYPPTHWLKPPPLPPEQE